MAAHVQQQLPEFRPKFELPNEVEGWLRQALEKRPQDRFRSAADALRQLRGIDAQKLRTNRYPVLKHGDAQPRRQLALPPSTCPPDDPMESSELRAVGLGLVGMRPPPVVGRDAEKKTVWEHFARTCRSSRPNTLHLTGPTGAGKRQFADWLVRRAVEGDFAEVFTSDDDGPNGRSVFERSIEAWLRIAGLSFEDAVERAATRFKELGFAAPAVVAEDFVARCRPESSPRRGLRGAIAWEHFVLELVERLNAPILWVFDRTPEESELLRVLMGTEHPVFIVCLASDADARGTTLHLAPLGDAAMGELIHAVLPIEPVLMETLTARAEGLPVVAVQMLTDWAERGILKPGPMGYRADLSATKAVPTSIHQVWAQRLRTAEEGAAAASESRRSLQVLALLGRRSACETWAAACRHAGVVDPYQAVALYVAAGLIIRTGRDFEFTHGTLCDSVAAEAPADAHLAVVRALEAESPSPDRLERQAHHLRSAGEEVAAFERLHDSLVAYDLAEDADSVLFLVPKVREWAQIAGRERSLQVADALVRLARLQRRQTGPQSGEAAAREALEIALGDRAVEALVASPEPDRNRVVSWAMAGLAHSREVDHPEEALRLNAQALAVAKAANCVNEAAIAVTQAADVLRGLGRLDEARELLRREVFSTDLDALTPRLCIVLNFQMVDYYELAHDYVRARAAIVAVMAAAEKIGDQYEVQFTLGRWAYLCLFAGQLHEARTHAKRMHELSLRARRAEPIARMTMLFIESLIQGPAKMRSEIERLLPDLDAARYAFARPEAELLLALTLTDAREPEAALELVNRNADIPLTAEVAILLQALRQFDDPTIEARAAQLLATAPDVLPPVFRV